MTYYEILEISENASQEVIHMAYKALCKKYHPDVYQGDKSYAEEQMKKINEAYTVLSDVEKRKQYDDSLKNNKQSKYRTYSEQKQEHKGTNIDALLKRGFMSLEDGEWLKADNFFEQALNQNAELAEAYLGKLMAELRISTKETIKDFPIPFDEKTNYKRAFMYASDGLKKFLIDTIQYIKRRNVEMNSQTTYLMAVELMNKSDIVSVERAIDLFKKILEYKDSHLLIVKCEEKLQSIKTESEIKRKKFKKKIKRISISLSVVIAIIVAGVMVLETAIMPKVHYNKALQLLETQDYSGAMFSFSAANGFKDSKEQIKKLQKNFDYKISVAEFITVALRKDGTVLAAGSNIDNKIDVYNWEDIIDIETGYGCTIGLKSDGTLVATGLNNCGELEIQSWENIIAVSAGLRHTVGLKDDGTVIAVGWKEQGQCDVESWRDIIAISAGNDFTVGLKSDGTVVAVGDGFWGKTSVSSWKDIIAISAGDDHVVGLKSNGTVVATGHNGCNECDVDEWNDIIAVSAGFWCTVGLKSDGTLVATRTAGGDEHRKISRLNNIVAISVDDHLVAVKADGTVVAYGNNGDGQCNVYGWDLD